MATCFATLFVVSATMHTARPQGLVKRRLGAKTRAALVWRMAWHWNSRPDRSIHNSHLSQMLTDPNECTPPDQYHCAIVAGMRSRTTERNHLNEIIRARGDTKGSQELGHCQTSLWIIHKCREHFENHDDFKYDSILSGALAKGPVPQWTCGFSLAFPLPRPQLQQKKPWEAFPVKDLVPRIW